MGASPALTTPASARVRLLVDRGERLDAIQRIARALDGRSFADINLMLRGFSFPTSDFRDWPGQYEYAVDMLNKVMTRASRL